jgi:hypothetical protein
MGYEMKLTPGTEYLVSRRRITLGEPLFRERAAAEAQDLVPEKKNNPGPTVLVKRHEADMLASWDCLVTIWMSRFRRSL